MQQARSKVAAEAEESARAEDRGYHQDHGESVEFFRELLVTLTPQAFHIEGYFEAHVEFAEDCHQARAEGQDPELVKFSPFAAVTGGLDDEKTTLLDAEASTPDHDGDLAGAAQGNDHGEDPSV